MTLQRDPDRIYRGRREEILSRLVTGAHYDAASAEHWLAEWERYATTVGVSPRSPTFWGDGRRWIAEHACGQGHADA